MKGVAHAAPERKKYKMSREGYRMTEQILKDSQAERWKNSPIAKVISIEDQARECPDDFTGESKDECAHFDLADPRVRPSTVSPQREIKLTRIYSTSTLSLENTE